jgi:hypothetical protein
MINGSVSKDVDQWLEEDDEEQIENLLLEGRSYLLEDREASRPKTMSLIRILPVYKVCL